MKVLLDECLPRRLKHDLSAHEVWTVPEMGWAGTKDKALLALATSAGFEVFITVDQGLAYQQNLSATVLAILLLVAPNNRLETLRLLVPAIEQALQTIQPGEIRQIGTP